jgi:cyclopropane fatty-acyl-phospholipid synthase-like methyltransferase
MSLTERETHFEFGENWKKYSRTIDQRRIDSAIEGVKKLFPDRLAGKTFLDIGCGSGLHSLAALSLGAASVTAIDIDENSVDTTRQILAQYAPGSRWTAEVLSIFDATAAALGQFDVVYSWGVLHHTGDMWRAIERAAGLVKPEGRFAIAIYAATACDSLWKAEKRFYAHAPRPVQWIVRQLYMAAFLAGKASRGQNPIKYVRNYSEARGMHFSYDAHDWLGGYPYETAGTSELIERISALGFMELRSFPLPKAFGLFGSGCAEFVFERNRDTAPT